MTVNRCQYTPPVRGDPDAGRVSCWRRTYRDSNRCIWHTSSGKSISELVQYDPQSGERLDGADLRSLDLRNVEWLAETILIGADFTNANVSDADFSDTDLRNSRFEDATACGTDFQRSNLERSNFRKTDLRGADLEWARLDGITFSESRITEDTAFGDKVIYEEEMQHRSDESDRKEMFEGATRTYGKLEQLAQDNSLNAQASTYYRKSKDVRRQFNWQTDNYLSGIVAEVSRLFTGYGNRPGRVVLTSAGVILLAAILYPLVGGLHRTGGRSTVLSSVNSLSDASTGQLLTGFTKSVYFSIVTFTTLGYGNLEPNTDLGRYIAGTEALVGTILLALFVGVLTRSTWLR